MVRLIEAHPDVKQVRLNMNEHSVTVGFYERSEETLNQIKTDVRAELSGEWDVSIRLMIKRRRFICTKSVITTPPNSIALIRPTNRQ